MTGSHKRLLIVGQGPSARIRLVGDWDKSSLDGLREARRIEHALDKVMRDVVGRAREAGCSWTEVGEALGTSKQAAWERFSREQ